jgi:hypothetical protein
VILIFNIQAAQTGHQTVVSESLGVSQALPLNLYTDSGHPHPASCG